MANGNDDRLCCLGLQSDFAKKGVTYERAKTNYQGS